MSVLFVLGKGGEHIEVPLASALFEGLAYNSVQLQDYPERCKSPHEVGLKRRGSAGEPMNLTYAELRCFLDSFHRIYWLCCTNPVRDSSCESSVRHGA